MSIETIAQAVSTIFGWIYFLCWSLSFYPQPILNFKRRSTAGFSIDFQSTNIIGFASYTLYTGVFLFNGQIREQYARREPDAPIPTVRGNDFAFALHGLIICIVVMTQFYPRLWNFKTEDATQKMSLFAKFFCLVGLGWIAILSLLVVFKGKENGTDTTTWAWIDVVYGFSYVKVLVSLFKYMPQLWKNYKRQSTVGWSIGTVLLDFSGGVLSLAQLVIDSWLQGDWAALTGNLAKVALALASIIMDMLFMIQHYYLYKGARLAEEGRSKTQEADEEAPLLVAN